MTRPVKLLFLRLRTDPSVPYISDRACFDMMFTGPRSVLSYWQETTGGYLDFVDSAMAPWDDAVLDPAATDRVTAGMKAVAAHRARTPDWDPIAGFDGVVVLSHPGHGQVVNPAAGQPNQPATVDAAFDGGAWGFEGRNAATLPVSSSHTFFTHEVGHVLGFQHTYGLDNNGTDWNQSDGVDVVGQVYGSPYDIMSAEAFGKRWLGGTTWRSNPVFAGPAVPGWPNASEASMGPHLSRAYLHLRWPDAFGPARVVDRPFPAANGQIDATVRAPSATDPGTVLVLHPPGEPADGVGRVYVEYRPYGGWDAGLDILGMDLGRTGVVVHSVVNAGGGDGITVWYRGSVPEVSFDIDVDLPALGLVLTAQRMGNGTADVTVRRVASQSLRIVKTNASDDIMHERVERTETTPCGDQVRYGTWITSSFCQFGVTSTGHGGTGAPLVAAPRVSWTVAGVPVSGTSGTVEIPFEGVSFTAEYTIDPVVFELALTSRGGERYTAQVVATVDGTATWASADFESIGWREGMHPDDSNLLIACLIKIVRQHRIPPRRFMRPDPGPRFDPKIITGVPLDRFPLWRDHVTEEIREIPGLSASDAAALERLIELQRPSG